MQKIMPQNMLIKELTIENFKTFVRPQKLKFAPITLLYGENSSGKTSIIKILDILMNIFGYNYRKPITDTFRYSFASDVKKNISPERINILSSYKNNKPIIIKCKIELKFPINITDSMIFDRKDLKEKIFFNEYNRYPRKVDDDFKTIFKQEKNLYNELDFCIYLKHFKSKKLLNNVSKVDKIEINYKDKNLFTYKRINKDYKFIENENISGFINPKDRKDFLKNYLEDQDFFTSSSGYADYSLDLNENSLIIDKSFKCYEEIIDGNQTRLQNIKKIIKFYKQYLSKEYLISLKNNFQNAELKKLKLFELVAKIILGNEKFEIKKLLLLKNQDLDRFNINLNKKYLKTFNKKTIIIFANLLSNIRNEDIYFWETILNHKINKKKYSSIIIKSFKGHCLRFKRNKYDLEMFPSSIIDENLENISLYKKSFEKINNIALPGVPTLLDSIFHIHQYLCNEFKKLCIKENTRFAGQNFRSQQLYYNCKRPSSIINECIISIFSVSRYLERTSPNSTEETFSIFTLNDLKKIESISIIKQFEKDEYFNSENNKKNNELLLKAANNFIEKQKIIKQYENEDNSYMDQDPTSYYTSKKNITELGEAGEFFNSIIINNKKERKKLNKYLKKYFDLEIIVVDLKYFKNFTKQEKIKIKQLLIDADYKTRNFNDKFVMIKDLKFDKKFSIHGIEIGKGPSNIFPFLLQILDDRPNLMFAIQELENNWHPKYHSKLILLLIEILNLSKNKSYLIETHSELFILQVKKLVEKGILKPEGVSINYIARNQNGESEICNIPLNSEGAFTKQWPGGFFTERTEILTS